MRGMHDGPHHQHRLEQQKQGGGMMDHGDHNSLRPHTHVAYHHVETACAGDVETLCTRREMPDTFGDPFLDWMLLSSGAAPVDDVEDITAVMDRMMESILLSPPFTTTITIYSADFIRVPEESTGEDINFVVDSTAAKLAADKRPEEMPELAQQLQTYGHEMMTSSEEGDREHHLGRRLTEMDASTLQHHVRLPFGCEMNACLMNALQQSKVSAECARSIQELQIVNEFERELDHRQEDALRFMSVYLVLLMVVLIMVVKKAKQGKLRRRLGHKILLAIYSNPELKRQVEEELGESVGHTPPLPSFALKMIGAGGQELKRNLKCMRRVHMSFLLVVAYMAVAAPAMVWPLFVIAMFVRVLFMCVAFNKSSTADECTCCCCGATTTNAALGALTEMQECCNCCKGTGVCSASCKSCCGSEGCCSCCGGKGCCCCCCNNGTCMKDASACCCCGATPEQAKAGELTAEQKSCGCCKGTGKCCAACASCCGGKGCCCCCNKGACMKAPSACCCCGATPEQAKAGELTAEQKSCGCCNGTGKCCAACSSCCGGKGCCCCNGSECCRGPSSAPVGRGQKHVVKAQMGVFEGVPMQIV
jgi:hypothetical protein